MDIRLKLSSDPSKAEEIDLYDKLISNLPNGTYLKMILVDTYPDVVKEIKEDTAIPLVSGRQFGVVEAQAKHFKAEYERLDNAIIKYDIKVKELLQKEKELTDKNETMLEERDRYKSLYNKAIDRINELKGLKETEVNNLKNKIDMLSSSIRNLQLDGLKISNFIYELNKLEV